MRIALIGLLALSGCSSVGKPIEQSQLWHHPTSSSGQLDANQYRLNIQSSGEEDRNTLEQYLQYRAAELGKQKHFASFSMSQSQSQVVSNVKSLTVLVTYEAQEEDTTSVDQVLSELAIR